MQYQGSKLTIEVSFDATAGSIHGQISENNRSSSSFNGRLELLSELELWQERARERPVDAVSGTPNREEPT